MKKVLLVIFIIMSMSSCNINRFSIETETYVHEYLDSKQLNYKVSIIYNFNELECTEVPVYALNDSTKIKMYKWAEDRISAYKLKMK